MNKNIIDLNFKHEACLVKGMWLKEMMLQLILFQVIVAHFISNAYKILNLNSNCYFKCIYAIY